MRSLSILHHARRTLLIAVLLVVLLARVAVPAGWMLMPTAEGGIVLAPCSGMGAMTVAASHTPAPEMAGMTMHDMGAAEHHAASYAPDDRHPDPAGDHPCSGAGVAVALDTPPVALPAALMLAATAIPQPRLIATIGHGLAAPPPPSTGPPFFA